jgi:hypothetical protein
MQGNDEVKLTSLSAMCDCPCNGGYHETSCAYRRRCESLVPRTPDPVTATTCARCSHTFTSLPDGFVDADLLPKD